MENLLNGEVIKAAASSILGVLCLMCLILGIVSLALFKDAPVGAKISVFVLLFIGVVGFWICHHKAATAEFDAREAARIYRGSMAK